ncbi:hypothetical protein BJV82DRAFT_671849 [Fennellomyces sp. T-0311]|nr:hypothetical protein BJV82DRAFT_671849 [Fennellomyces sp. T-0311]
MHLVTLKRIRDDLPRLPTKAKPEPKSKVCKNGKTRKIDKDKEKSSEGYQFSQVRLRNDGADQEPIRSGFCLKYKSSGQEQLQTLKTSLELTTGLSESTWGEIIAVGALLVPTHYNTDVNVDECAQCTVEKDDEGIDALEQTLAAGSKKPNLDKFMVYVRAWQAQRPMELLLQAELPSQELGYRCNPH